MDFKKNRNFSSVFFDPIIKTNSADSLIFLGLDNNDVGSDDFLKCVPEVVKKTQKFKNRNFCFVFFFCFFLPHSDSEIVLGISNRFFLLEGL